LDGYETTYSYQQHVNFVSADNHVLELWYQERPPSDGGDDDGGDDDDDDDDDGDALLTTVSKQQAITPTLSKQQ
jgi:hypothetical protein